MKESLDEQMSIAFQKAHKKFGEGTSIGRNLQKPDEPCYVKVSRSGDLMKIGYGKTWDEAIANVKDVAKKHR